MTSASSTKSKNKDRNELAPVRGGTMLDLDLEQVPLTNGISSISANDTPEQDTIIIVPNLASWFKYNSTHAIEKRALPEFFNNSCPTKTPDVFLNLRNCIIELYRLQPSEYLSVKKCRQNISGDILSIVRIHAFLEQWGLINYHVEPPELALDFMSMNSLNQFQLLPSNGHSKNVRPNKKARLEMFKPEARQNQMEDEEDEDKERACSYGLKLDDYAYYNAIFQAKGAATLSRDWTEAETLLLLEAIELHRDDWHKVCEHVGSRRQDECILHFLRLPIEDPFLKEDDEPSPVSECQPTPFSKSGNPIMSTLAFLASAVDSKIAASAAKAALKEFSRLADIDSSRDEPIEEEHLATAADHALKAAASTSRHLASVEERKIKSLVTTLVDIQLKKLDIKLKHFEELDSTLDKEKETIEGQRKQFAKEQNEFQTEQLRAADFREGQIRVQNMINPNPHVPTAR